MNDRTSEVKNQYFFLVLTYKWLIITFGKIRIQLVYYVDAEPQMFDLYKDPDEMNSMVDEEKYDQMTKSKNVPILIKKN